GPSRTWRDVRPESEKSNEGCLPVLGHWWCRQPLSDTGSMATMTPVASAVSGVFPFSMQAQQSIVVDPKSPGSIDSPHGLILFDGVCVLCSRGCGFVSKRDRRGYFRFVPMQLAEGRPLAEQLGINPDRPARAPSTTQESSGSNQKFAAC